MVAKAKPYKNATDDYLATVCSFAMLMIFICSTLYKYESLTTAEEISDKMSLEQQDKYIFNPVTVSAIMLASMFGSLVFVLILAVMMGIVEGRKRFERLEVQRVKRDLKRRELHAAFEKPDGLKWKSIGAIKPKKGKELHNEALAEALTKKTEFTHEEWAAFRVSELVKDTFILSAGLYFLPCAPQLTQDEKARRDLCREALGKIERIEKQTIKASDATLSPAEQLFSSSGIPPMYWGINRKQLADFRVEVQQAITEGRIKGQPDPLKPFFYPQDKFDNPSIGPNMHQVNAGLIKPITLHGVDEDPTFMPGLSYALMRNFATGGLPCHVFFSHGELAATD